MAAIAALTLLASIAGLAAQSVQPPRQPAGLIVGQVVDGVSGRPLSGAVVALTGDVRLPDGRPLPTSSVLTTPDGRFVFRDLPAGTFGITASKSGYHEGAFGRRRPTGSTQQLTLSEGERIVDAVILLWKPGAISGTLVDEAGEPVVNVIVVAYRRSMSTGVRSLASSATSVTDDRGVYRLGALRPGDYIVGVSVRHFSPPTAQARAVTVSTSGFDARAFTLLGSSPAMLQVGNSLYAIGGGSTPAASSGVQISIPPLQIDSGGRFVLNGLAPGTYRVGANAQGLHTPIGKWWLTSILIEGREALDSTVDLRRTIDGTIVTLSDRASALSGIVRDNRGEPVADEWLVVFSTHSGAWLPNSRRIAAVRTGANGSYSIRNLPAGEYHLATTLDLQQGEWFDAVLLQQLESAATRITITDREHKTIDPVLR